MEESLVKLDNYLVGFNKSPTKSIPHQIQANKMKNRDSTYNKYGLETKEEIFDNVNLFSSYRETFNTSQTSYNKNYNSFNTNKKFNNFRLSKKMELKNSPMKIIDKISKEDLEIKDESLDLKEMCIRQKNENKIITKNLRLEKFVKEIEIKEEHNKNLLINDNQSIKPCCNDIDCLIF